MYLQANKEAKVRGLVAFVLFVCVHALHSGWSSTSMVT